MNRRPLHLLLRSGFFLLLLALTASSLLAAPQPNPETVAQLAVQDRGRKKPLTTFTQESLLTLSGRSDYRPDETRPAVDANSVLLDLWLHPESWEQRPLILVSYQPLAVEVMGLPARQKLFSYRQVADNAPLRALLDTLQNQRMRSPNSELSPLQRQAQLLAERLQLYEVWSRGQIAIVPHPSSSTGSWLPIDRISTLYTDDRSLAARETFTRLRTAWMQDDTASVNESIRALATQLAALAPAVYPPANALTFERFYQQFHPFRWAWIAYALGGIVLGVTTLRWQRAGYRLGWGFVLAGFALQAFGFISRIVIAGRPPVTNMYETVVWLAFGTILFAIVLEAVHRCRYFLLAAAPVAVLSLVLADALPTALDSSINPLVPVLRNNYWLIIHVLTITLSYAAFALATAVAHIILGKLLVAPERNDLAPLHNYLYRTLQVGVLLLAAGTILGGVWANYSWGRFWDWDPKETWALIALLCYLLVLHGRLTGWWSGFGTAIGSVLCFLAVLMAWYGVNFVLGKGLHSYGFGTGGYGYAVAFALGELFFIGIVLVRKNGSLFIRRPASNLL